MRNVRRVLSFAGGSEGDADDESGTGTGDASAIARISRGHDDVPETVGGYEIEMNSRINVRWVNDDEEVSIECSRAGDGWRTEIHEDGRTFVVSTHSSFEEAVDASERLMTGQKDDGVPDSQRRRFEEEVESVLEEMDTESIDEFGEAFGD
ncbi:MAG: hypothetical protein U5J64_01975 [Halobacteriales archaeon]|nr:hypothetical protein [Halobacteriales archaeon]